MDPVDWQVNKTHLQCTKHMHEQNLNCDVNFRVGADQEIIKAHRFILSMRSPVFEKMFNGMFIESKQDPVIPDIDPDAFRTLLRYCYYDCLEIELTDALYTLQAATKYMLPELADTARQMLLKNLTVTNIWQVYTYSVQVDDEQFLKACREYFQKNVKTVWRALDSKDFLHVTYEVLVDFLNINHQRNQKNSEASENPTSDSTSSSSESDDDDEEEDDDDDYINETVKELDREPPSERPTEMDGMGVCISEIMLFKACNAWAAAECLRQKFNPCGKNKRLVLRDCLFLLCLPTMRHKDLFNIVYPTHILSQAEKDGLSVYKHNKKASEYSLDFPLTQRKFLLLAAPKLQNRHHSLTQKGHYSGGATRVLSSLCIESTVAAEVSKIWLPGTHYKIKGSANVTITNDNTGERWSKPLRIKRQHHLIGQNRSTPLFYLAIKGFVLTPNVRYSFDVSHSCDMDRGPWVGPRIQQMSRGKPRNLGGIHISGIKKGNQCVYALTVSLI